tara:strand:+ start:2925 stop:3317 length:393 start_codon:yes stop_codon:yes gene_type:complete
MEKLKLITGNLKLKILFIGISFLSLFFIFDTWEHNFDQYKVLQNQLNNRIQHANELRDEIGILSQQIEDLDNPEKLEVVLREYGYGKPGEKIDVFEVPEPITPLDETLQKPRNKSFIEYFIEYIVGKDGE